MYDWPEQQAANDAYWVRVAAALRARGIDAPDALSRPADHHAPWTDPDLLLAQTCGMPLVLGLCGAARVVARASYGLPGTGPGTYASALVVRAGDPRGLDDLLGGTVALNAWDSQSGRTALVLALPAGRQPLFARAVVTGSHRASARAVAAGAAELAALDAVSWAALLAWEPATARALRRLAWTPQTPGLPFITTRPDLAPALVGALAAAIGPAAPGLPTAIHPATDADYAPIAAQVARAQAIRLAPDQPTDQPPPRLL